MCTFYRNLAFANFPVKCREVVNGLVVARQQLHPKAHVYNLLESLEGLDYGLAKVHKVMVFEDLFKGSNVRKQFLTTVSMESPSLTITSD